MASAPAGTDEADVELMVRKYRDPERKGLLNYRNLHDDIVAISLVMAGEGSLAPCEPYEVSDYLSPTVSRISVSLRPRLYLRFLTDFWALTIVVR